MAELAPELLARLKRDARHRCGYCLTSELITGQPLTVDHLIPVARGRTAAEENLWMACRQCNEKKGVQLEAVDPETRALAPLFNPRKQRWHDHFSWSGDGVQIVGLTVCGRATVVDHSPQEQRGDRRSAQALGGRGLASSARDLIRH